MKGAKESIAYKSFLQLVGQNEIQRIVSLIYDQLNASFATKVHLGSDAYSFCAAVLYTYYRKEMKSVISTILARVWTGECPPQQLKPQIDSAFRREKETLYPFNEGVQWLKQHATWIEQHDMHVETKQQPTQNTNEEHTELITFTFTYGWNKRLLEKKRIEWLESLKDRFFYAHDREYIVKLAPFWLPTSVHCPVCEGTLFDLLFPNNTPFHTKILHKNEVKVYQMFTCPACKTIFASLTHPTLSAEWMFHPVHDETSYLKAIRTLSYRCIHNKDK